MSDTRKIGLWSLVFYAFAMNLAIRWLATGAATGAKSLPIWPLAGLVFLLPLLTATLDLSARFPGEGAIYTWTGQTQGKFAGFMCGWIYWTSNIPYFAGLLIFVNSMLAAVIGGAFGAWLGSPMGAFSASAVLILVVGFLHSLGLGAGKWIPLAGATATLLIYAVLVGAGLWLGLHGQSATNFATADYRPPMNADGAILWSAMVFAYGGAEGVALLRNTVKGGIKTLRTGLIILGVTLSFAFLLGTAAMLMIIPQEQASRLAGLPDALKAAAERLHIVQAAPWLILALALSQAGAVSAWFGAAARLPFAAGIDAALPKAVGYMDPKTGAPVVAIWLQVALVIIMLALSQAGTTVAKAYDFIVAMGVLSYTLPYLFMFVAYWKAQSLPEPEGGTGVAGGARFGRWMAAVGFVGSLTAILCSFVPTPDATPGALGGWMATIKLAGAGLVLIVSGAILYVAARRKTPS